MSKKFWVVKETKKDREKRKARRKEREDDIRQIALGEGKTLGYQAAMNVAAAAIFTEMCKEPGKVTAEITFDESLIGQIASGSRYGGAGKLTLSVHAKNLEP